MEALDTGRVKLISCKIHVVQQLIFNVPLGRSTQAMAVTKAEFNFSQVQVYSPEMTNVPQALSFICVPRLQQSSASLWHISAYQCTSASPRIYGNKAAHTTNILRSCFGHTHAMHKWCTLYDTFSKCSFLHFLPPHYSSHFVIGNDLNQGQSNKSHLSVLLSSHIRNHAQPLFFFFFILWVPSLPPIEQISGYAIGATYRKR